MNPEAIDSQQSNKGNSVNQSGQNVYGPQLNAAVDIIINHIARDDAHNQRNHTVLRQAVHRFWIDGFLESLLHNRLLIRLGLESNLNAVVSWLANLPVQQPNQSNRSIRDDKQMTDIFNEMSQQMLTLGKLESSNTTFLLIFADTLFAVPKLASHAG